MSRPGEVRFLQRVWTRPRCVSAAIDFCRFRVIALYLPNSLYLARSITMSSTRSIEYSEKYADDLNEYRWVPGVLHLRVYFGSWLFISAHLDSVSSCNHGHSHVILPKELAKTLPKSRLLTESEWRGIGVQQSRGWQHYAIHRYVWLVRTIHSLTEMTLWRLRHSHTLLSFP